MAMLFPACLLAHERKIVKRRSTWFKVKDLPQFPGGEAELRSYIANQIVYPSEARKDIIQGKVYVTFDIDETGKVVNAKVIRSVDPLLDQEALRVVSWMPKWNPGKYRGKPVKVAYTIQVNFASEDFFSALKLNY